MVDEVTIVQVITQYEVDIDEDITLIIDADKVEQPDNDVNEVRVFMMVVVMVLVDDEVEPEVTDEIDTIIIADETDDAEYLIV